MGPVRTLCESLEKQQGAATVQSLRMLVDLVDVHIDCGNFLAAEINAEKAIEQGTILMKSSKSNATLSLLFVAYINTSYLLARQRNFFQAETNLRKAQGLSLDERYVDACSKLLSFLHIIDIHDDSALIRAWNVCVGFHRETKGLWLF